MTEPDPHVRRLSAARWNELLLALLVLASIGGIAVSDFTVTYGLRYWAAMVPLFGAVSLFGSWSRTRARGHSATDILRRQILHWLTLLLAMVLIYVLQTTGRMNDEDAGLVAMLALSITTFLAGVHFDWRFSVVGILLGATVVFAAFMEEYFWVLLVPAVLAGVTVVFWRRTRA